MPENHSAILTNWPDRSSASHTFTDSSQRRVPAAGDVDVSKQSDERQTSHERDESERGGARDRAGRRHRRKRGHALAFTRRVEWVNDDNGRDDRCRCRSGGRRNRRTARSTVARDRGSPRVRAEDRARGRATPQVRRSPATALRSEDRDRRRTDHRDRGRGCHRCGDRRGHRHDPVEDRPGEVRHPIGPVRCRSRHTVVDRTRCATSAGSGVHLPS